MTGFAAALSFKPRLGSFMHLLRDPMAAMAYRATGPSKSFSDQDACFTSFDALAHARPGGPLLCGDLFILNGPELAAAADQPYVNDAHALLAAYDKWGAGLGDKIEGEFAFVIWDPSRRRMLALRDRFGVKPLAYSATKSAVLVASETRALARDDTDIDPVWVAQYLAAEMNDAGRTPFSTVRAVPPGHMLICENGAAKEQEWYRLRPVTLSEQEAPEALAEALERAVKARLDSGTATLLSGGIDSGSITRLAASASPKPLRVVSMRFPAHAMLDEGAYIAAVRARGNILGLDIPTQAKASLDDIECMLRWQGQPVFAPNHALLSNAYRAVASSGARNLLDGHGGDEVIGTGGWYFSELAHQRRWRTLWREARRFEAAGTADFRASDIIFAALAQYGPRPLRGLAGRVNRSADPPCLLSFEAQRLLQDVGEGGAQLRHDHLEPYTRVHARLLLNPGTSVAFEFLDRVARRHGIEARFPFYDRSVVEICIGQPTAVKIAPGLPRMLLRNAMKGVLPEKVRLRRDKTDFTSAVVSEFRSVQLPFLQAYANKIPDRLRPYVDQSKLQRVVTDFDNLEIQPEAMAQLSRVLSLNLWLAQREGAAVTARSMEA